MDELKNAITTDNPQEFIRLMHSLQNRGRGAQQRNGRRVAYMRPPMNNANYLKWAAEKGHVEVLEYLRSIGANLQHDQNIAYMTAAKYGQIPVIEYLLANGVPINAEASEALLNAVENNQLDTVRYLIDHNLDPSEEDLSYDLTMAAMDGNLEMVQYLFSLGADPLEPVNDGYSAVHFAMIENRENVINFFREQGIVVPENVARDEDDNSEMEEDLQPVEDHQNRRRRALEHEEQNEAKRRRVIDEIKTAASDMDVKEETFIERNCGSTSSLLGDPLQEDDNIVIFLINDAGKGDCYLKSELSQLRSSQYIRGNGEKAYKLPWSGIWIPLSLKIQAENMEGKGPIQLVISDAFVGYGRDKPLYVKV